MGLLNSRWRGAPLSELSVNSERRSGLFHSGDLSQASLEMEVASLSRSGKFSLIYKTGLKSVLISFSPCNDLCILKFV